MSWYEMPRARARRCTLKTTERRPLATTTARVTGAFWNPETPPCIFRRGPPVRSGRRGGSEVGRRRRFPRPSDRVGSFRSGSGDAGGALRWFPWEAGGATEFGRRMGGRSDGKRSLLHSRANDPDRKEEERRGRRNRGTRRRRRRRPPTPLVRRSISDRESDCEGCGGGGIWDGRP